MQKFVRTETPQHTVTAQAPRRGPVPLDPALLVHVAGGAADTEQSPHSRWSPIDAASDIDASAPHGRW